MIDKELFSLLGSNKKYIFIAVVFDILRLISNVAITACICWVIYLGIQQSAFDEYLYPIVCIVIGIAVRYVLLRASGEIKDVLGRRVKKDLRERSYDKILNLGLRSTEEISMAGLTQISVEGIEQLDLYYTSYIPQFFFAMIAPIILFAVSVTLDWRVALVLIVAVPLIPVSIIAVSKYAKKIFAKYWGIYTGMGDKFLDSVQGLKELKLFMADEKQHAKMNQNAEDFRKITMKVLIMQLASTTIMDLVAYGGAGIGIAIALIDAINGRITPIESLFLILIAVDFFLPLRAFGSAFHISMNGVSAGKKILALLNSKESKWGDEDVSNMKITVENVTFSYDGKRDVLKDVNMVFPDKGMTAIVGESGSGKSTIVSLMIGAIHPKCGEITIGDKRIENLSRKNYYSHIGLVSYDTYVFNDTVKANFALAKSDITDEEIYGALKKVNLDEFIRSSGGLDKLISEDADNISGGQKQRLALAVSLASDKDIYIFDEATSNIDVESEAIIMRAIESIAKEKSVIVISHRLANVTHADRIYFMSDGEVAEEGSHAELMDKDGGYARLYLTQKSLENGYKDEEARYE